MKFDSSDVKAFCLGVFASITAVILWDYYKRKRDTLEYGEKKTIEEIRNSIEGLKKDLING